MKKFLVLVIALTIIGLLGWRIYHEILDRKKPSNRQREALAVAVEIAPIQKTSVRDIGSFTGTLNPRAKFIVAPKISGRLEKLLVNIGDRVKRGQLIAVLEDDEFLQQLEQARAELEVARAQLEDSKSNLDNARREFDRVNVLREKKIASASELDAAQAQFGSLSAKHKVALAQVTEKGAALKGAEVRLSYTRIHANWEDGNEHRVVGERFMDEGAMLAPNSSIVTILDIGSVTAVIHVIERDYPKLRIGQHAVVVTDAFPDRSFPARIVRIAPLLRETSREARAELEVPNSGHVLKPGMFVRVQIEFEKHEHAVVVPLTALAKRNGQQGVFVADRQELKAHFVPVTLGIVNNEAAEVLKPPLTGWVVILGQHLLEDGATIILPKTEPVPSSATTGKSPSKKSGKP